MNRRKQPRLVLSLNEVNAHFQKGAQMSIALVGIFFIAILMIGFVYQKVRLGQLLTEVEALQKSEKRLLEKIENHKTIKYELMNNTRIAKIATENLNMVSTPSFELIKSPYDTGEYEKLVKNISKEISPPEEE